MPEPSLGRSQGRDASRTSGWAWRYLKSDPDGRVQGPRCGPEGWCGTGRLATPGESSSQAYWGGEVGEGPVGQWKGIVGTKGLGAPA